TLVQKALSPQPRIWTPFAAQCYQSPHAPTLRDRERLSGSSGFGGSWEGKCIRESGLLAHGPASRTTPNATSCGARRDMTAPVSHIDQVGEESSVWFKLTPLLKGPSNPLTILMLMAERYGGVIPVNMANQRVVLLTEPEHFKRVLVTKADDYIKYFDG